MCCCCPAFVYASLIAVWYLLRVKEKGLEAGGERERGGMQTDRLLSVILVVVMMVVVAIKGRCLFWEAFYL
jgi:hypothetical protein